MPTVSILSLQSVSLLRIWNSPRDVFSPRANQGGSMHTDGSTRDLYLVMLWHIVFGINESQDRHSTYNPCYHLYVLMLSGRSCPSLKLPLFSRSRKKGADGDGGDEKEKRMEWQIVHKSNLLGIFSALPSFLEQMLCQEL